MSPPSGSTSPGPAAPGAHPPPSATRHGPSKTRAAGVSIAANALLIVLKLVAGAVTGSVAIISEAIQSSIDLVASVIAFISVRKAEQPADEEHRYGHEKAENLAAAVEGLLILVGAGIIIFEATRRLVTGAEVESLGFGIAVIAFSAVSILLVSIYLGRRARQTDSPALEGDAAHLRTDAFTSFGVLAGLVLVEVTGEAWIDAAVALAVAAMIITTGIRLLTRASRVLMDEALPEDEMREIDRCARALADRGVVGYHKVRTRRAGPRRHIDLHVQFRSGTSLEDAHAIAHELERAIKGRLDNADVLIHIEPAASVRRGERFSWAGDVSDTGQK